jgi:hypothetical protein
MGAPGGFRALIETLPRCRPLFEHGPLAQQPPDEEDFPDDCYLDCTFQPQGNIHEGFHPGLTDVDLTGNKLDALPADLASTLPLLRRLVVSLPRARALFASMVGEPRMAFTNTYVPPYS